MCEETIHNCFGNCNSPTETISAPSGDYFVYVKYYSATYNLICQIDGVYTVGGGGCIDNDNDGICLAQDCDDNNPNLPTTVGSPCNDGNANTINDVIQSDGCTCQGSFTNTPDCADVSISTAAGAILVGGIDGAPVTSVQVFNASWITVFSCFADCDSPTQTINVPGGDYIVYVKYYSDTYQLICQADGIYSVPVAITADNEVPPILETQKSVNKSPFAQKYGLFDVFPNPAQDQLFIDFSAFDGESIQLYMIDAKGAFAIEPLNLIASETHQELDISQVPTGIYQLMIRTSTGQSSTQRVVVLH